MKLEISSRVADAIVAAADASRHAEICGLLFGTPGRIDDFLLCGNVAASPQSAFEIDPAQLLAAHKAMRAGGARIVGCFHSHPNGLPEPSPRDAAAAAPDGTLWLIVSGTTLSCWRAVPGAVRFKHVEWRGVSPDAA